jgi:hypothetical protein
MCAKVTWRAAVHGLHAVGAGRCAVSAATSEIHAVGGVAARLGGPRRHRILLVREFYHRGWRDRQAPAAAAAGGLRRQRRGWSAAPTCSPLQQLGVPRPPQSRPSTGAVRGAHRLRPPTCVGVGNPPRQPPNLDSAPLPPPPAPLHGHASTLPSGGPLPLPVLAVLLSLGSCR